VEAGPFVHEDTGAGDGLGSGCGEGGSVEPGEGFGNEAVGVIEGGEVFGLVFGE
jgi:hypothetical protein